MTMRVRALAVPSLAAAGLMMTAAAAPSFADGHAAPVQAQATIINLQGEEIGMASLRQGPTGVLLHIRVSGLTPGAHGFHLHSHGACDPEEGFTTAKGHVGLIEGGHGLLNPDGPEAGDLPNLFVGADGIAEMEAFNTLVSLVEGPHNLLDEDGSTFVIHANPDDHMSQPIGGSGPRVACGLIEAAQ